MGHATRPALASVETIAGAVAARAALLPAPRQPPSALQQLPPDTTRSPYDVPRGGPHEAPDGDLADGGRGFAGVRWEEPRAKRARVASQVRTDPLKGDPDKTVFVRNLAFRADEGALAEFFAQCGEIVDLRLGRDVESGRSRGYCHVAYSTAEAAEKALALHETTFYGRDIVVQMAKSDEERNADRDRRKEERRGRMPPPPPGGCWFCLSNEKDTHLVASIATESFIAMDKGGVVPDHCQVVPVEHTPSFAALSPSAADEIWRYLGAIRACLRAGGGGAPVPENAASPLDTTHAPGARGGPRELVAFERHLALRSKGGNHMHLNWSRTRGSRSKGEKDLRAGGEAARVRVGGGGGAGVGAGSADGDRVALRRRRVLRGAPAGRDGSVAKDRPGRAALDEFREGGAGAPAGVPRADELAELHGDGGEGDGARERVQGVVRDLRHHAGLVILRRVERWR